MLSTKETAREARLRRLAQKFDLQLCKSRRRNPEDYDYGCLALVDAYSNVLIFGEGPCGYGASLDDVEEWLSAEARRD